MKPSNTEPAGHFDIYTEWFTGLGWRIYAPFTVAGVLIGLLSINTSSETVLPTEYYAAFCFFFAGFWMFATLWDVLEEEGAHG